MKRTLCHSAIPIDQSCFECCVCRYAEKEPIEYNHTNQDDDIWHQHFVYLLRVVGFFLFHGYVFGSTACELPYKIKIQRCNMSLGSLVFLSTILSSHTRLVIVGSACEASAISLGKIGLELYKRRYSHLLNLSCPAIWSIATFDTDFNISAQSETKRRWRFQRLRPMAQNKSRRPAIKKIWKPSPSRDIMSAISGSL